MRLETDFHIRLETDLRKKTGNLGLTSTLI
jgi:hypothetical protein